MEGLNTEVVAAGAKTSQMCAFFGLLDYDILKAKELIEFTSESFVGVIKWLVSISQFQKLKKAEKSLK